MVYMYYIFALYFHPESTQSHPLKDNTASTANIRLLTLVYTQTDRYILQTNIHIQHLNIVQYHTHNILPKKHRWLRAILCHQRQSPPNRFPQFMLFKCVRRVVVYARRCFILSPQRWLCCVCSTDYCCCCFSHSQRLLSLSLCLCQSLSFFGGGRGRGERVVQDLISTNHSPFYMRITRAFVVLRSVSWQSYETSITCKSWNQQHDSHGGDTRGEIQMYI